MGILGHFLCFCYLFLDFSDYFHKWLVLDFDFKVVGLEIILTVADLNLFSFSQHRKLAFCGQILHDFLYDIGLVFPIAGENSLTSELVNFLAERSTGTHENIIKGLHG